MNRCNRQRWAEFDKAFEERIKKRPEVFKKALEQYERDLPFSFPGKGLEHRVQEIIDDERADQTARARRPHKKRDADAIDRVIIAGIRQDKTAPEIWEMLVKAAGNWTNSTRTRRKFGSFVIRTLNRAVRSASPGSAPL